MSIKVTVKLFAALAQYLPSGAADNRVELEVADGTTVEQMFAKFNLPPEHCHLVLINGHFLEFQRGGQKRSGRSVSIEKM